MLNIKEKNKENVIISNYEVLKTIFDEAEKERISTQSEYFAPPFELPNLNNKWEEFFDVANISTYNFDFYNGMEINLLNLAQNPGTQTTKTLASLLMVARAIQYIQKNKEGIIFFTPSSGNKATALRDAVERAIKLKLVSKEQLRIISIVPENSKEKMRKSFLTTDNKLRKLNPTYIYKGAIAQDVKEVGKDFIDKYKSDIEKSSNSKIWYSLDIKNYMVADSLRAFYVNKYMRNNSKTIHAHSVSSAYGLLGFNLGQERINNFNQSDNPGYLLVQHMKTSDMVLNLLYGDFSYKNIPDYTMNDDGIYTQKNNPNFPFETWNTNEILEPTFYSHCPPTSEKMNNIIKKDGGTGIVV